MSIMLHASIHDVSQFFAASLLRRSGWRSISILVSNEAVRSEEECRSTRPWRVPATACLCWKTESFVLDVKTGEKILSSSVDIDSRIEEQGSLHLALSSRSLFHRSEKHEKRSVHSLRHERNSHRRRDFQQIHTCKQGISDNVLSQPFSFRSVNKLERKKGTYSNQYINLSILHL